MALLDREIRDKRVLDAMAKIPRELFVPEKSRDFSYEDRPLPIGLRADNFTAFYHCVNDGSPGTNRNRKGT